MVGHLVEWVPPFLHDGAGVDVSGGRAFDEDPPAGWFHISDAIASILDDPGLSARTFAHPVAGRHTLVAAPTGSGKTFAAFLAAIDGLVRQATAGTLRDETHVVRGFDRVNRHDIWMVQRGGGAGFLLEPIDTGPIGRDLRPDDLDRDVTAEPRVAGAINFAHPARAERLDDFVGAEVRPGCHHRTGLAGDVVAPDSTIRVLRDR